MLQQTLRQGVKFLISGFASCVAGLSRALLHDKSFTNQPKLNLG